MEDLEVRYAPDLPLVLRGISFTVSASEKIGVVSLGVTLSKICCSRTFSYMQVGRTGSGIMFVVLDIGGI